MKIEAKSRELVAGRAVDGIDDVDSTASGFDQESAILCRRIALSFIGVMCLASLAVIAWGVSLML